eukprot:s2101_g13.t1
MRRALFLILHLILLWDKVTLVTSNFAALFQSVGVTEELFVLQEDFENGISNSQAVSTPAQSSCTEAVVLAQNRQGHLIPSTTAQTLVGAQQSSFQGRRLPTGHQAGHGIFQCAMEVSSLSTTQKAQCYRMPYLSCSMADSNGQVVCPCATAEKSRASTRTTADAICCSSGSFDSWPWRSLRPYQLVSQLARRAANQFSKNEAAEAGIQKEIAPQLKTGGFAATQYASSNATNGSFVSSIDATDAADGCSTNASRGTRTSSYGWSSSYMAPPSMPPPDTPWTAAAMHQALPAVPVMPAMPAAPVSTGAQNSPTPEEIQELLQMMKNRQSELPSDMQQKLQKMTVKTRARLTKDHHSAVTLHSKAREEFDNAISARSQLLANWKAFIGDAVRLWQGYAQNFAEQERNLQTRIANAKENVIAAKEELDKANKQNEIQEIASDEEYGDMDTSSSTKVRENMECLANSLQILEREAAEMVEAEAHVSKRARKESPKAPKAPDGTRTVENTDEGLVVYFNTYYISHWTNVRQPFGRAVRLDRHFRSWERVLRLLWGDLFDHNEPFDVVLVVPESPFAVEPEAVGTLLIVQHPHAQRAACVTTAIIPDIPSYRTVEIAHSFETIIGQRQVLFHADVLDVCEHRIRQYLGECTIRVGRYQYPQARPVRVHDGLRLLVDVPPPMAPQDWEDRLHHRLQQRAREAPGITFPEEEFEEEPDDVAGLLARSPVASLNVGGHLASSPPSSMSNSSATDSTTSTATTVVSDDWHLALIFSLNGAEREIDVPWHDGKILFERVAQRFGIRPSDIAAVHTVLPCPQDLCRDERRAMILQRQVDQPAAPFLRLVLVDVEYKQDASGPAFLLERRVRWLPQRCTRSSAIRLAGYDGHCSQDPERCWMWHNGNYVAASHAEPLVFDSGHYLRIAIPANPHQAICETGEAYWPSDHDDYHWPPDLDESSPSFDDEESVLLQSAIVHWKLDSDDLVEPALSRACISTDAPQALVRQHGQPDDFQLQEDPLWRLWHRPHLHTRGLNNEPVLLFETWYVSGLGYPKCAFSRAVALDEDLDNWISKLRQVWHDRIHPQVPVELSIVHPEVPNVRHGGHLILLQAVPPHQRASLLSSYWDLDRQELHDRFAQVVPRRLSFQDLLRFNDLDFVCQQPNFNCVAFVGPHQFEPHEAWPIYHGMHLEVHVGAPVQAALDMPLAGDAAEPDAFQPGQPAGPHPAPDLTQVSSFTRELLDLWSRLAFSWEGEATSLDVVTWMVDHHDNDLRACHHPRIVQLSAAYQEWELQIRHAWADLLNDNLPATMYVVTPIPPSLVEGASVHVIVVQRPFVAFATILLTAIDHTVSAPPRPLQVAITTLEQIYLDHLLIGMGLEERCLAGNVHCQAWHADQELQIKIPLPGRNGLSIILEISAPASAGDGVTLLQLAHYIQPAPSSASSERLTNASVAHARWPEDKPPEIQLDLAEAWSCFETYDQSFLLPCFDLDPALHTAWTNIWWDCQSAVTHIWIYHDGSHKAQGAGAAAVAFLFQPGCGWVFGGALSAAFQSSTTSYGAEVRSGILAVQFAIDILKITTLNQSQPPEVCLLHDNTTVGAQLTGRWNANADVRAVALMRHLAVYCERRFNLELSTWHVSAHTGDVGNELADVLAGLAADQKPLLDLHDWFVRLHLCLPSQASTTPSLDVLPKTFSPIVELDEPESNVVDLVVGTCNVLTLKTDARQATLEIPMGISGPTRQHIIFKQFKDAGVCIAVLQETRLQRHCKILEDYLIYAGAATPQGHFGVLAAISTTIPYGHVIRPHGKPKKLYFTKSDIAVVSSSPRWIVLRVATPWLKFVLIGAHAPHSGQSLETIDAWWTSLAQTLPSSLVSWPRILLADANAKVGADHCSHIGDVGAEIGGDKAVPFTTFVRDQHLWLPSTFDCHQGPSGTWRHSSGQWHRNDFVGLPQQWTVNTCRSWVSEDIDVSLHHEDHCAALVHFTLDVTPRGAWRRASVWKHHAEDADLSALRWLHPLDRGLDVHSHAAALQQQILD